MLPSLSWEGPQGSISQSAITHSQNATLPPTFRAVAALFNAIHRLLNRDALRTGWSLCHKVTRSNTDTLCLIAPAVSVIWLRCNEWVWSVILNIGRATGLWTHTNNAMSDCQVFVFSWGGILRCYSLLSMSEIQHIFFWAAFL